MAPGDQFHQVLVLKADDVITIIDVTLWLNYQIEHHLIPDLPMRQYRTSMQQLKAFPRPHPHPCTERIWTVFRQGDTLSKSLSALSQAAANPRSHSMAIRSLWTMVAVVVWCGAAMVVAWADDAVPTPAGNTPQSTSPERLSAR